MKIERGSALLQCNGGVYLVAASGVRRATEKGLERVLRPPPLKEFHNWAAERGAPRLWLLDCDRVMTCFDPEAGRTVARLKLDQYEAGSRMYALGGRVSIITKDGVLSEVSFVQGKLQFNSVTFGWGHGEVATFAEIDGEMAACCKNGAVVTVPRLGSESPLVFVNGGLFGVEEPAKEQPTELVQLAIPSNFTDGGALVLVGEAVLMAPTWEQVAVPRVQGFATGSRWWVGWDRCWLHVHDAQTWRRCTTFVLPCSETVLSGAWLSEDSVALATTMGLVVARVPQRLRDS